MSNTFFKKIKKHLLVSFRNFIDLNLKVEDGHSDFPARIHDGKFSELVIKLFVGHAFSPSSSS